MSAFADQIAASLAAVAAQVDDSVVTVGHTYTDGGGTHSQTFEAIRGGLNAEARAYVDGAGLGKAYLLTVDVAEMDEGVEPKQMDEVTVRQGDDAAETMTIVRVAWDGTKSVCILTVAQQYEA